MKTVVATCQFPIDRDIEKNCRLVQHQMREARRRGAHIAHFPECALSGYAGVEFPDFAGFDWATLRRCLRSVMAMAGRLRMWVVLGSSHRLSAGHKPHNSVYVIDSHGHLVDRYDKRFCVGDRGGTQDDLAHFTPGNHFVTFDVRGVHCGVLICHDMRYPELYREYAKRGANLIFHSYHNGHGTKAKLAGGGGILATIVPATMQANAANNHCWISAANTCRPESYWPSFFVTPDGLIHRRLIRNRRGVLISTVDPSEEFADPSQNWRPRALRGIYHSGRLVRDLRSRVRSRA